MPILTPLSLIVGVLLDDIGDYFYFLLPWIFAFMTFASSLSLNFKGLKSFTKYPLVILFTIAFLHILMPIWAYFVSEVLFNDHLLTIGFILSVAVPTGVTSFIWVSICRGHLSLCLSIILIDTLLSPIIIPLLIKIIVGQSIEINMSSLMLDLLWMIVLPSIVGMLLNEWTKGKIEESLGNKLAPFSKISVFCIVLINGSVIAPYFHNISWMIVAVIIVVFLISISGYAFCLIVGHFLFKKDYSIITTVMFTGGMRNIALGVVVASTYFPAKVVAPVVFGMLFQQVLASQFGKLVEKYKEKFESASIEPTVNQ